MTLPESFDFTSHGVGIVALLFEDDEADRRLCFFTSRGCCCARPR